MLLVCTIVEGGILREQSLLRTEEEIHERIGNWAEDWDVTAQDGNYESLEVMLEAMEEDVVHCPKLYGDPRCANSGFEGEIFNPKGADIYIWRL